MTAIPLSDNDIRRALASARVPARIVSFRELSRFSSIDDLLLHGSVVLFLELPGHIGHWQAVMRTPTGIEVWGPYGLSAREALATLDPATRTALHENLPLLQNLLKGHEYRVNRTDYEAWAPSVLTCGRWVVLRLMANAKGMTDKQFDAWLTREKRAGESNDELVVRLTRPIVGK